MVQGWNASRRERERETDREREREREREMYTLVDFKSFLYFTFDIKIGK